MNALQTSPCVVYSHMHQKSCEGPRDQCPYMTGDGVAGFIEGWGVVAGYDVSVRQLTFLKVDSSDGI